MMSSGDATISLPLRLRSARVRGSATATARAAPKARAATPVQPTTVAAGGMVLDALAILAASLLSRLVYDDPTSIATTLASGGGIAVLFVGIGLARGDYRVESLLRPFGHLHRAAATWFLALGLALALCFLTKTSATFSRGANGLVFAGGLGAVLTSRCLLAHRVRRWSIGGRLALRRLMLVGTAAETAAFIERHRPDMFGMRVVGGVVLRGETHTIADDLDLAVATARLQRPDELFLLVPWEDQALIDRSVAALKRLPAAIHLGPSPTLSRYASLGLEAAGALSGVRLVRQPLSAFERAMKRAIDLVGAGAALLLLGPLLMLIAVAIKVDSTGPVLFRQRRTGYNQQPFNIYKFRSMTTMEDSAALRQVTRNDARITRLGRLLRRTSIDELPQLINVLRGQMSLIGPRPHALAHDRAFGAAHALYARRHNMRPGITGWAQVNGFRGETDTPAKIEGRVRLDLDYIDNWSIWLDLRIIMLTVFSPKTFQNAR